jgi:nicotinamide-nucleotide amidase
METLVQELAEACLARGIKIATVESCTGGMVAAACTDLAGSSAWFERGWVTYSNAAKMQCVGVLADTLAAHGAVSERAAREMADGGRAASGADVCLAVTGIAGPGGAVPGKPVGMVCFAWATRGPVEAETCYFEGDRAAVRTASVVHALRGLLTRIR